MKCVAIEVQVTCKGCQQPIALNAVVARSACDRCGRILQIPARTWKLVLQEPLEHGPSRKRDEKTAALNTEVGLIQVVYRRTDLACIQCHRPVAPEVALRASERYVHDCPCGARSASRRPEADLAVAGFVGLFQEDLDLLWPPPPRTEAVVLRCPSCGAGVQVRGDTPRITDCSFCRAQVYIPDELWALLHPVRPVRSTRGTIMHSKTIADPIPRVLAEVNALVKNATARRVSTSNGASAGVEGGALTLRDAEGALVARFDPVTGVTELAAARGDLRLSAPHGKVILDAASDIEMTSARDLVQRATRKLSLEVGATAQSSLRLGPTGAALDTDTLTVHATRAALDAGEVSTLAERVAMTAADVAWTVGRMELRADRWRERVRDLYSEVDGLLQTKAARLRTLVAESFQLSSRRTRMVSKEETAIDGRRVLLG